MLLVHPSISSCSTARSSSIKHSPSWTDCLQLALCGLFPALEFLASLHFLPLLQHSGLCQVPYCTLLSDYLSAFCQHIFLAFEVLPFKTVILVLEKVIFFPWLLPHIVKVLTLALTLTSQLPRLCSNDPLLPLPAGSQQHSQLTSSLLCLQVARTSLRPFEYLILVVKHPAAFSNSP